MINTELSPAQIMSPAPDHTTLSPLPLIEVYYYQITSPAILYTTPLHITFNDLYHFYLVDECPQLYLLSPPPFGRQHVLKKLLTVHNNKDHLDT